MMLCGPISASGAFSSLSSPIALPTHMLNSPWVSLIARLPTHRCPNLKSIETTFGSYLPSPNSNVRLNCFYPTAPVASVSVIHWSLRTDSSPSIPSQLFAFDDLEGFSLTFKGGFYAHGLHVPSRGRYTFSNRLSSLRYSRADTVPPSFASSASSRRYPKESNPVFARLWDMLIVRSPNLQSLAIVGTCNEPGDGSRLSTARWPNLKSLTVGDIVFDSPVHHAPTSQAFTDFLERHPTLEVLNLHGHPNVVPVELGTLSDKALPSLKSFSGALHHLRALAARGIVMPHHATQNQPPTTIHPLTLAHTLQSVSFPEPMQLRDLTPLSISAVLQGMHSLTSLEISFSLQSGYDSNGVLRTIVSSCPSLINLDLTCACKPSFYMVCVRVQISRHTNDNFRPLTVCFHRNPSPEPSATSAN